MVQEVFPVEKAGMYKKAGPTDLVKLLPVDGCNSLFIQKWLLETLVYGIASCEFIHLSGPTGSAKTSLMEALYLRQENFRSVCQALGFVDKPLGLHPIEMVIFDTPGELVQRRALKNGTTFDERSPLVEALVQADQKRRECYQTIWLREMGRVHSASIQGGLLDLMTRGDIVLPDGNHMQGAGFSWVADSNYQAESDATHTLVTFDDALRRRFTINLTLDYPSAEQEVLILHHLVKDGQLPAIGNELVVKVVALGQAIRRHRIEGNLLSVPPPTLYGYQALIRMVHSLPHLSLHQIAAATLLGNANPEDQKLVSSVFNEVFGLQSESEEDPTKGGNLF
jgi:hypothetical protein